MMMIREVRCKGVKEFPEERRSSKIQKKVDKIRGTVRDLQCQKNISCRRANEKGIRFASKSLENRKRKTWKAKEDSLKRLTSCWTAAMPIDVIRTVETS